MTVDYGTDRDIAPQELEVVGSRILFQAESNMGVESPQRRHKAPSLLVTGPSQVNGQNGVASNEILFASPLEAKSPAEPLPALESELSPARTSSFGSFDSTMDDTRIRMKTAWERSIHQHLNSRGDYDKVGVLLIKWAKELDELHTDVEVAKLKEVFEKFEFEVEILELGNEQNPTLQLMLQITNFAMKYESLTSRNLMIVYYTGHGYWDRQASALHLSPRDQEISEQDHGRKWPAHAVWNSAERALIEAKAHVLAIMDTCFASNLMEAGVKSNITVDEHLYRGMFELLCASGRNKGTPGPGEGSFTNDLIHVLKELLNQPNVVFSTFDLTQRLTMVRDHRYPPPQLWNRMLRDDDPRIRLATLSKETTENADVGPRSENNLSNLTLQFELDRPALNDLEVQQLSKFIGKACTDSRVGVQRVEWKGIRRQREARERLQSGVEKVALTNKFIRKLSRSSVGSEGAKSNDAVNASPRSPVASPTMTETNALHPLDPHRKRPSPNADLEPQPQRHKSQSG